MKKLLLTLSLISMPAFAFENYIIVSDTPYKFVSADDVDIVKVAPVYTIDNVKKYIIVTPVATGKTNINIWFPENSETLNVQVKDNTTYIKPKSGFEYFSIDTPPQSIMIPKPPLNFNNNTEE